jgi:hypothetical protein
MFTTPAAASPCRITDGASARENRVEIGVQRYDGRVLADGQREDIFVRRRGHSDLAYVGAVVAERRVSRNSLVEDEAHSAAQAALVSVALSSRLAAANANACWTSSGSNSG